jgi:hypothetical protein
MGCAVVAIWVACSGCGSSSTQEVPAGGGGNGGGSTGGGAGTSGGGGGASDAGDASIDEGPIVDQGTSPRVPRLHRAAPDACSMNRPAGNAVEATDAGDACRADSDCRDGINGRCFAVGGPRDAAVRNVCSYDQCLSDDDCSGRACGCRESAFRVGAPSSLDENRCFGGDCRVDADCGQQGYCSPSTSLCGTSWGAYELRCHTPGDECVDDADCANFDAGRTLGGPAFCAYDGTRSHWACFRGSNVCPDGGAP